MNDSLSTKVQHSAVVSRAARRLGIRSLRPEQALAVGCALSGRDVLVVLPTGSGKSACYQIPSMVMSKPVVLVSPLLALLQDQQKKLEQRNIPCLRIDGTVRGKARRAAYDRLGEGGPLLVMTTPETLATQELKDALGRSGVALAAIDEAHCISEWGFDFRPAYLRLGEILKQLGGAPLMGLTATAVPKVRADIVRFLGMREPEVVAASPHRSNLAFEVIECSESARLNALIRLLQRLRRPGIVYCATTKKVDDLYVVLRRLRIPAHRYHGKMSAKDREREQIDYMRPNRRTVMVATSAFGLGIDKRDIRYIVHAQVPASLEQYVQEAGRAGRDGKTSHCVLLFDPADRAIHEALLGKSRLRPEKLFKLGEALSAWVAEGRDPTLAALAVSADLGPRATSALVAVLEEAGLVRWRDDVLEIGIPIDDMEEQVRRLASQFDTLRREDGRRLDAVAEYAVTEECRARHLRGYFGEPSGAACGLCDTCRGGRERPPSFFDTISRKETPVKKKKRRRRRRRPRRTPSNR